MLKEATTSLVEFCELVEHPGGYDGGEFPKYEIFELHNDQVTYTYAPPQSPTDTFCDEDPVDYNLCPTKREALKRLRTERDELVAALRTTENLIEALEKGVKYEAQTD